MSDCLAVLPNRHFCEAHYVQPSAVLYVEVQRGPCIWKMAAL